MKKSVLLLVVGFLGGAEGFSVFPRTVYAKFPVKKEKLSLFSGHIDFLSCNTFIKNPFSYSWAQETPNRWREPLLEIKEDCLMWKRANLLLGLMAGYDPVVIKTPMRSWVGNETILDYRKSLLQEKGSVQGSMQVGMKTSGGTLFARVGISYPSFTSQRWARQVIAKKTDFSRGVLSAKKRIFVLLGGGYEYEASQRMKWGLSWALHVSRFPVNKKFVEKTVRGGPEKKKNLLLRKKTLRKKVGFSEFLATFKYFFISKAPR